MKERFLGNQAELCMQAYPNLQITCATAYDQRIVVSEHECRDLCLKMSAQTCQYNKIRTKSCVPSVTPNIGFLLFLNDDCDFGESKQANKNVTSKQSTFTAPGNNSINMVSQERKSLVLDDRIQEIRINATVETTKLNASIPYYSSRNKLQHEFRSTVTLSSSEGKFMIDFQSMVIILFTICFLLNYCASGFSVYIEAIDGIQVIDEGLATFQTRTPKICLHKCMKNKVT
ncbi:unnamed protein product [Onchocerca flexuosa]|uniref:Apple domain-containing protein n=1 Tax=Onchocerca flexuosa TaxID=387005 RepID=A0A183H807_9BILA|nr:unnamed protein product [Onchocerca flexuosa]